ncbi:MAG: RIP metalloprotease RseP [Lysobacteraceae bacterium]
MTEILGPLLWFIVAIGVLITFHEFGHYWVARRCGVRVLRFSIGFGPALASWTDREGVEWRLGAIPLGGYVAMLDEREGAVPDDDRPRAFNRRPVGQRIAIVAAGPLANAVLAVLLVYAMLVIGKPDYAPVLGAPQGLAAEAGFAAGDRLLAVDGRDTPTWTEATQALMVPRVDRRPVDVRLVEADGDTVLRRLPLDRVPAGLDEPEAFAATGLRGRTPVPPAVVGGVMPGSAADGVLREGDRLLAIDGMAIGDFTGIRDALDRHPLDGPPPTLRIEVDRDGARLGLDLAPRLDGEGGDRAWRLGVRAADARDALLRYGPLEAVPRAVETTAQLASDTVAILARMVTGAASLQNLSGPISIARAADTTAQRGAAWFLYFLAMLSVSIALLNLLPIPALDGGHLLYYLIELVRGRPLSDRVLVAGHYAGLALLASLMGLALFNDVLRLAS